MNRHRVILVGAPISAHSHIIAALAAADLSHHVLVIADEKLQPTPPTLPPPNFSDFTCLKAKKTIRPQTGHSYPPERKRRSR